MYSEQHCAYRATDVGEADLVVAWLQRHGIAARVKDRFAATNFEVPGIAAPAGIEVCVIDSGDVDRARELLRDHFDARRRAERSAASGMTLNATCEECGKTSPFPAVQMGSVQTCPHCSAYLDLPEEDAGC